MVAKISVGKAHYLYEEKPSVAYLSYAADGFIVMLFHRLLCTTVVLVALALVHWPQFARTVIIVEDDSNLTALNDSIAKYDTSTRVLHITGNSPFKVTLAASDPVLSIDVKLEPGESKILIASAEFLSNLYGAACKWEISTAKSDNHDTATCKVKFTVNRDEPEPPGVLYYVKDDNNMSMNCRKLPDFVHLQVDMYPDLANIVVGDTKGSLEQCTKIRPTCYNQSITRNNKQRFPSDVTNVWEIGVVKTSGQDFFIRLPKQMTPVRLDPDPPTTTAPPTTTPNLTTTANNSMPGNITQPGGGKDDTGLSGAVIGAIIGGVILFIVAIVVIVLAIVWVLRRRTQQVNTNTVEEQLPPDGQPAEGNQPDQREDGKIPATGEKQQTQNELKPRVLRNEDAEKRIRDSNAQHAKHDCPTTLSEIRSDWASANEKPPSKEDRQALDLAAKETQAKGEEKKADDKKVTQSTRDSKLAGVDAMITTKPTADADKGKQ